MSWYEEEVGVGWLEGEAACRACHQGVPCTLAPGTLRLCPRPTPPGLFPACGNASPTLPSQAAWPAPAPSIGKPRTAPRVRLQGALKRGLRQLSWGAGGGLRGMPHKVLLGPGGGVCWPCPACPSLWSPGLAGWCLRMQEVAWRPSARQALLWHYGVLWPSPIRPTLMDSQSREAGS